MKFNEACSIGLDCFEKEWKKADEADRLTKLEIEKKAIMGFEEEMNLFKSKIDEIML